MKRKGKFFQSVLCGLLLTGLLTACGGQTPESTETEVVTETETVSEIEAGAEIEAVTEIALSEDDDGQAGTNSVEEEITDPKDAMETEEYVTYLKQGARPEEEWSRPYYEKVKELSDRRLAKDYSIDTFGDSAYGEFELIDWKEGKPPILRFFGDSPSGDSCWDYLYIYKDGKLQNLLRGDGNMNHKEEYVLPEESLFVCQFWGVGTTYYTVSLETGETLGMEYDPEGSEEASRYYRISGNGYLDDPYDEIEKFEQGENEALFTETDQDSFAEYLKETTEFEMENREPFDVSLGELKASAEQDPDGFAERIFTIGYYDGTNGNTMITANYAKPALLGEDPD